MAFAHSVRPIESAVATLGVSDRVAFLRKTYGVLGASLVAFAALTAFMMKATTALSLEFSMWALRGWHWLLVIGLFVLVGHGADRLARSETSRGLQYLGLGVSVASWAALLQPLLWVLIFKFGDPQEMLGSDGRTVLLTGQATSILMQAVVITLAIFLGLTLTVFVTKKDFSFLRGALAVGMFGAFGVVIASLLFGFSLGALFCGAMILLMSGYILYQTTLVMSAFPPSAYVAAALMLFSTVAMLFWYVLNLLMSLNRR